MVISGGQNFNAFGNSEGWSFLHTRISHELELDGTVSTSTDSLSQIVLSELTLGKPAEVMEDKRILFGLGHLVFEDRDNKSHHAVLIGDFLCLTIEGSVNTVGKSVNYRSLNLIWRG